MDVEKTLEFLISHQARMAGDLQQLTGNVTQLAGALGDMVQVQRRQQDMLVSLIGNVDRLSDEVRSFKATTEERFRQVAENQERTDSNLNALIKIVDDIVRRDGRQQP